MSRTAIVGVLVVVLTAFAPGPIMTAQAAPPGCDVGDLAGAYGFNVSGTFTTFYLPGAPLAFVGVLTFDGLGALSGTVLASGVPGFGSSPQAVGGTYTVNPDCSGSYSIDQLFSGGGHIGPITGNFVVVESGREVLFTLLSTTGSDLTQAAGVMMKVK